MSALDRIAKLRRGFDYRGARATAEAALRDAAGAGERAALLAALGRLQEEAGDYEDAVGTLEQALALDGVPEDVRARAWLHLVWVRRAQAREADAEAALHRALAEGHDGPERAELLAVAAAVATDAGEFDAAEAHLAQARPIAERTRSVEARVAVDAAFGTLRRVQGRYAEAEAVLRETLARAREHFGERSIEVANLLNDLGVLLKFSGVFDEAHAVYTRGVEILEAAIGADRPPLANDFHNLGGLEHARGNFAAAEPHARRSVAIRERAFGPGHVLVAIDKAALAAILDPLGRHEEAEQLLREALVVVERELGALHRETAAYTNNLAAILHRRGDHGGAEALYRRALAVKERLYGADAPPLAGTLNNLAVTLKAQGRREEAAALYRRAIAILDGRVDGAHPALRSARRNLERLDCDGIHPRAGLPD